MAKEKNPRRCADNEALAKASMLKGSAQKLNLVAQSIRGMRAERAKAELQFSRRRAAKDVLKVLNSAIANAENNHDLDIDSLVVAEAFVGKSMTLKRFHARGRGRAARVHKHFSEITIKVREVEETA